VAVLASQSDSVQKVNEYRIPNESLEGSSEIVKKKLANSAWYRTAIADGVSEASFLPS